MSNLNLLIFLLLVLVLYSSEILSQEKELSGFRKHLIDEPFNNLEVRSNKRLEKQLNKPQHDKHKQITNDYLHNKKSARHIFKTMQREDYDSTFVVDSVCFLNA